VVSATTQAQKMPNVQLFQQSRTPTAFQNPSSKKNRI
jgi:hypothetical protein